MPEKDSLKNILAGGKPKPDEVETTADDEFLSLADMAGNPLRPANRTLTRLHVIHRDGTVETLFYHHIDAKAEYRGNSFTFLFSGARLWELTVEGRNLWRMFDYISLSRWPFIRVATRDFDQDGEVVTAVRIKDVTPRGEE